MGPFFLRGWLKMPNLLVVHGGAPTAVLNATLYGVLQAARESGQVERTYGACGGTQAVLEERFFDFSDCPESKLKLLLQTPGSVIGSSRYPVQPEDYQKMVEVLKRRDIRYVFFNGGNGTMDACGRLYAACKDADIRVVGIPKTIDNDIAMTDHAPGYGSAARYMAATVREVAEDVRSLPIHVCVLEAMGRNAGWIAASSALARDSGSGPDLIYLPERPFREAEFLEDVERIYAQKGAVLVVVSEGLTDETGASIVPPIFQSGRSVYYGDVSAHLAGVVIRKLGIKARSEKPGICGRASIAWQSPVDRAEAVEAGRQAVRCALQGASGVMVGFARKSGSAYAVTVEQFPIAQVMLYERKMPDTFINDRGNDVTDAFMQWCRPLIGGELPAYFHRN